MVSKTVQVVNEQGMHMRPAGLLVAEMKKFPNCVVMLNTNGKSANADNGGRNQVRFRGRDYR